jgi:hypothetical protein
MSQAPIPDAPADSPLNVPHSCRLAAGKREQALGGSEPPNNAVIFVLTYLETVSAHLDTKLQSSLHRVTPVRRAGIDVQSIRTCQQLPPRRRPQGDSVDFPDSRRCMYRPGPSPGSSRLQPCRRPSDVHPRFAGRRRLPSLVPRNSSLSNPQSPHHDAHPPGGRGVVRPNQPVRI